MVKKFTAIKVKRGSVTVYMPEFGTVLVDDGVRKTKITRGGNYRDGLHRWSTFRLWLRCGAWKTGEDVRIMAIAKGHNVEDWHGDAPDLPLWEGKTWLDYTREWRKRR